MSTRNIKKIKFLGSKVRPVRGSELLLPECSLKFNIFLLRFGLVFAISWPSRRISTRKLLRHRPSRNFGSITERGNTEAIFKKLHLLPVFKNKNKFQPISNMACFFSSKWLGPYKNINGRYWRESQIEYHFRPEAESNNSIHKLFDTEIVSSHLTCPANYENECWSCHVTKHYAQNFKCNF
jgi:hypothetical protein